MNDSLENIELEAARIRLEREKLALQKEQTQIPKSRRLILKYFIVSSLIFGVLIATLVMHVEKNNKCESWKHFRWMDLYYAELGKDPVKLQTHQATVGRILLSEVPVTWAGARSEFSFFVGKAINSGLIDGEKIDDIVSKILAEARFIEYCN